MVKLELLVSDVNRDIIITIQKNLTNIILPSF